MGRRALGCAADQAHGGDRRRLGASARAVECPVGVRLCAARCAAPDRRSARRGPRQLHRRCNRRPDLQGQDLRFSALQQRQRDGVQHGAVQAGRHHAYPGYARRAARRRQRDQGAHRAVRILPGAGQDRRPLSGGRAAAHRKRARELQFARARRVHHEARRSVQGRRAAEGQAVFGGQLPGVDRRVQIGAHGDARSAAERIDSRARRREGCLCRHRRCAGADRRSRHRGRRMAFPFRHAEGHARECSARSRAVCEIPDQ